MFLRFLLDNLYQGIHEYLLEDVLEGIRYILALEGPVQLVGPFYQGSLGIIRHIGGGLHKGIHFFLDLTLKGIEKRLAPIQEVVEACGQFVPDLNRKGLKNFLDVNQEVQELLHIGLDFLDYFVSG